MAKRRMRRTNQNDGRRSPSGSLGAAAAEMSLSAVRVATGAAQAALEGMQQIGRTMAEMAAPAAQRTVKTANAVTRVTMDGAADAMRTGARSANEAAGAAARTGARSAKAMGRTARRASVGKRGKTRKRRAA